MDSTIQKLTSLQISEGSRLHHVTDRRTAYSECEVMVMKTEFERMYNDQDRRLRAVSEENAQFHRAIEQTQAENETLRKAIQTMEKRQTQAVAELHSKDSKIAQLEHELKQLRQTNYALQVHLQQSSSSDGNNHSSGNQFSGWRDVY